MRSMFDSFGAITFVLTGAFGSPSCDSKIKAGKTTKMVAMSFISFETVCSRTGQGGGKAPVVVRLLQGLSGSQET